MHRKIPAAYWWTTAEEPVLYERYRYVAAVCRDEQGWYVRTHLSINGKHRCGSKAQGMRWCTQWVSAPRYWPPPQVS